MEAGKLFRTIRERKGISMLSIAKPGQFSRGFIRNFEEDNNKNGEIMEKVVALIYHAGFSTDEVHEMAHAAFKLPPPEEMNELGSDLKELCELFVSMTEEERAKLLASVHGYIKSKNNLFSPG